MDERKVTGESKEMEFKTPVEMPKCEHEGCPLYATHVKYDGDYTGESFVQVTPHNFCPLHKPEGAEELPFPRANIEEPKA